MKWQSWEMPSSSPFCQCRLLLSDPCTSSRLEFKKLQKLWLHYCVVLCSLLKESFEKWHLVTRDLQGFGEELQSCLIDLCGHRQLER